MEGGLCDNKLLGVHFNDTSKNKDLIDFYSLETTQYLVTLEGDSRLETTFFRNSDFYDWYAEREDDINVIFASYGSQESQLNKLYVMTFS